MELDRLQLDRPWGAGVGQQALLVMESMGVLLLMLLLMLLVENMAVLFLLLLLLVEVEAGGLLLLSECVAGQGCLCHGRVMRHSFFLWVMGWLLTALFQLQPQPEQPLLQQRMVWLIEAVVLAVQQVLVVEMLVSWPQGLVSEAMAMDVLAS